MTDKEVLLTRARLAGLEALEKSIVKEKEAAKVELMLNDFRKNNQTMIERINREAELALMTDRQRAVAEALYKAEDEGAKMRERILRDIPEETAQKEALAKVEEELARQKERVTDAVSRSQEAQRTFEFGWSKAFTAYADSAGNSAKMAQEAFDSVTSSMESAIANFVRTGKLSFSDFATSVLSDLSRIAAKQAAMGLLDLGKAFFFGNGTTASSLGIGKQEIENSIGIASVFHEGGIVGAGGGVRSVPMSMFAGAKRFHSGGWPGLTHDEVPAILQKGERVLKRGDTAGGGSAVQVNVINNASGAQARQQQRQDAGGKTIIDVIIESVKGSIINDIGTGGTVAGALEKTYAVNRAAGAWR